MKGEDGAYGREVACRVLSYLFKELPKKGVSPKVLEEWSGYPLEHLRDKHGRMSWSSFCRIHSKLGELYTDEELMEFGKTYLEAPGARVFLNVAKLLFTPVDFFRWMLDPKGGVGVRNFTVVQPRILETRENRIVWEVTIKEGYEFCREFFIISKGTSTYISELLGLEKSVVEMEWIENGARYYVELPSKGGILTRLRKMIAWLFTARAVAQELKEQHEILYQRYTELEAEMKRRKEITNQLFLLQKINNAINTGMSLKDVLQIAADGIKEVFGYVACDILLLDEEKENLIYTTLSIDSEILQRVEKVTGLTIIGHRIPLSTGSIFTEVMEKRRTFITSDIVRYFESFSNSKTLKLLADEIAQIVGFKYVMRVPLVAEKEIIGTIGVASNREFTKEDVNALERFGSQMAVAIRKKQLEEALQESEERYRSLVESASDVIFTLEDGKVTSLNPAFERFSGFHREEWLGRDFYQLVCPEDQNLATAVFERAINGEEVPNFEIRLLTANGEFKWGELSVKGYEREEKTVGVLCIIRDISERKRVEEEVKRRLMRFRLEDGKVYLAKEASTIVSIEAFSDLLKVGYRGLVISHTPESEFKVTFPGSYGFVWLAEMADDAMIPNMGEIENYLSKLPRKNVVLIDRFDYLIFKNGFERALTFVQRLREIAYLGSHVVIISLDPATLSKTDVNLIEKETWKIEAMHKEVLPEDLFEVLAYIYKQNSYGVKPSYKDISKDLNISKPTVQKRVRSLVSKGYIKEVTKGNRKEVEILERGRAMFLK